MKLSALSLAAILFSAPAFAADAPPAVPLASQEVVDDLEYDFVQVAEVDLKAMRIRLELDLEENDPGRLVWIKLDPNVDVSDAARKPLELEDLRVGDQVSVSCDRGPDGKPVAVDVIDYSRQYQN